MKLTNAPRAPRGEIPVMSDALADDQRDLRELVLQRKAALAELAVVFLPLLAFGTAGLQ